MFLLAVCILFGSVRLAKREVVQTRKLDKEKIRAFSKAFGLEVRRLDELYLHHLDRIANNFTTDGAHTDQVEGLVRIYEYSGDLKPRVITTFVKECENEIPEVAIVGEPVDNEDIAFFFPEELLDEGCYNQSGWLGSNNQEQYSNTYLVRWIRVGNRSLIAIIIDREVVADLMNKTLKDWMKSLSEDLVEGSVPFKLTHSSSTVMFVNDMQESDADVVIPFYSSMDEWKLRIWRRTSAIIYYDITTLALAAALGGFLLISGALLYKVQRSSLNLALQRVSFVNQVSHELGSPLTNIGLNLELVSDQVAPDNAKVQYRIGLIAQEIERLNRLVANVLTFSRHERGALDLRYRVCSLNDLIEGLLESYKPALVRRGIEIEWVKKELPEMDIDPDAFVQIMANLISNVEKYAFSGKYLLIKTEVKSQILFISVMDKGPGIPRKSIDRIFDSFERIERGMSEGSSGAGLGLSISKSLAIKLGGEIKLKSYEDGCCFELSLPII